jgi:hypothetical protein
MNATTAVNVRNFRQQLRKFTMASPGLSGGCSINID